MGGLPWRSRVVPRRLLGPGSRECSCGWSSSRTPLLRGVLLLVLLALLLVLCLLGFDVAGALEVGRGRGGGDRRGGWGRDAGRFPFAYRPHHRFGEPPVFAVVV